MQKRWIIIVIIGLVLLVVLALCGLTVFASAKFLQENQDVISFGNSPRFSAQANETLDFEAKPGMELVIYSDGGGIRVEPGEDDEIHVEMVKTAWRADEESAAAAVEDMKLLVTEADGRLVLTYKHAETGDLHIINEMADSIEMLVLVPAQINLELDTNFGEIYVKELQGDAELTNDFGNIEVHNLQGALSLNSQNGELVLENITTSSGDISADTSFGEVRAEGLSADNITLNSTNGDIHGSGLDAERDLLLQTSFGEIRMEDLKAGTLTAESQNGVISLENGHVDGHVLVKSDFGAVTVLGLEAASYELFSNNGDILLDGCRGTLDLNSSFGSIEVLNAEKAVLNLETSNGQISFEGSLDAGQDQTVKNEYGEIILTIPAESAFDINIETEFGTITSEIPITLSGEIREDNWIGELNGGGKSLSVKTNNGNITISVLNTRNSSGE